MLHRHLKGHDLTDPMYVDDVICRGKMQDWIELQVAVESNQATRDAVLQVCEPHIDDPYNHSYVFWHKYLEARLVGP